MSEQPPIGTRRPWEVYSTMPGVGSRPPNLHRTRPPIRSHIPTPALAPVVQVDSLYSGLSKRTPSGGFFTS